MCDPLDFNFDCLEYFYFNFNMACISIISILIVEKRFLTTCIYILMSNIMIVCNVMFLKLQLVNGSFSKAYYKDLCSPSSTELKADLIRSQAHNDGSISKKDHCNDSKKFHDIFTIKKDSSYSKRIFGLTLSNVFRRDLHIWSKTLKF